MNSIEYEEYVKNFDLDEHHRRRIVHGEFLKPIGTQEYVALLDGPRPREVLINMMYDRGYELITVDAQLMYFKRRHDKV